MFLASALKYAERGWPVCPIRERGKKPILRGGVWSATTDVVQVKEWWELWPWANIGVQAGPDSGVLVVDVDGDNGIRTIQEWAMGEIGWAGNVVKTGGNGWHLYFKWRDGLVNRRAGPGVDIRTKGALFTAPPSIHKSGKAYVWFRGENIDLKDIPEWLYDKLVKKIESAPYEALRIPTGNENKYCETALTLACEYIRREPPGNQANRLNKEAYSIGGLVGGGYMDFETVVKILVNAGMQMVTGDKNYPWSYSEVYRIVSSAVKAGALKPRALNPVRD